MFDDNGVFVPIAPLTPVPTTTMPAGCLVCIETLALFILALVVML